MVKELFSNLLFLGLEESFITLLFLYKVGNFRKFSFNEYMGYSLYLSFMRLVPPLFRQVLLIVMTAYWLTIRDKEKFDIKKSFFYTGGNKMGIIWYGEIEEEEEVEETEETEE